MKKLMVLFVLVLSGCVSQAPKTAKVGECFIVDTVLYKVLEVGQYSVLAVTPEGGRATMVGTSLPDQVDCFDRFKE